MAWTARPVDVAFCPSCAAGLGTRETHEGERPFCADCSLTLYRNPVPMARATVVDGDELLLVELGEGPDEGSWAMAGGHCLPAEPPAETAARELAEETGLTVDADALELVGDGHLQLEDAGGMVSFNYAAPARAASGTVAAARDAAAAGWFGRGEIRSLDDGLRASGPGQLLDVLSEF
jgi:8-oxo-dGTP diphosphatase